MFEWHFRISPDQIPLPLLEKSYFARWGRIPCPTLTRFHGDEFLIFSDNAGSGTIHVPRPNPVFGIMMEATESLLSRDTPYILMKELARGALGRFTRRLFDWQMLGFVCPEHLAEQGRAAVKRFAQLVVETEFTPNLEQEFVLILNDILQIITAETRAFTDQSLAWRMRNHDKIPLRFGIGMRRQRIDSLYEFDMYAKFLRESFQTVLPSPSWRELEPQPGIYDWERLEKQVIIPARFGFQIILGPLLSFDTKQLPEWLVPRLSEEGCLETNASLFVNAVTERYGKVISGLILADRFMETQIRMLPPERSVELVRILAQQLRSRGYESPLIVCINQPWGEYALDGNSEWEQIHIAEQLVGCKEIDAFLLEMNFGGGEYLTLPRDPVSIGNMVDQWSFLGKKMLVSISVPSAGNILSVPFESGRGLQWSDELQRQWTETLLTTLLGKRLVQGIFWSRLQDGGHLPDNREGEIGCGLVSSNLELKPAVHHFRAATKALLK
ncbi:MAG: beta-galactosidase [Planctomycetaceae bacterium]|jgi:hypothetical protein|nr:beta-galactosidase [Planctomycetaceae bacterium]